MDRRKTVLLIILTALLVGFLYFSYCVGRQSFTSFYRGIYAVCMTEQKDERFCITIVSVMYEGYADRIEPEEYGYLWNEVERCILSGEHIIIDGFDYSAIHNPPLQEDY